jgi:hypothetical protein
MELLDSYLKAVKRYLPRGQRNDIIAELSEELRSQMESREAELGRPLRDTEQMAIFLEQGDPMIVARRYRQSGRSLTIGWELIGPELFPMYLIILALNLTIAVGMTVGILLYLHVPITLGIILRTAFIQIACVTLTFTILNLIRHKFPQPWYYPPAALSPMMPVARWYSVSGLAVWSVFTLWWAAVPVFPGLLFGYASANLKLAPSWHRFYLPVLVLLGLGIAQRAINLVRPLWNWLLPLSRFFVNAAGLALQYPMIKSYPYVVVTDGAKDPAHFNHLALVYNGSILWGVLSWMWGYLLISALIYAWYCVPQVRRLLRQQSSDAGHPRVLSGIV